MPLGPPPGLCPRPTGGLQQSADPLLISSCLRHEKRPLVFYKLNLEHKNRGMTKCLEKSLRTAVAFFTNKASFYPESRDETCELLKYWNKPPGVWDLKISFGLTGSKRLKSRTSSNVHEQELILSRIQRWI